MNVQIQAIIETAIYVDDLDATERFYRDIFGLRVIAKEPGRHVFFQVGTSSVLLAFIADANAQGRVRRRLMVRKDQAILPWALKLDALDAWREQPARQQHCHRKRDAHGPRAASPSISVIRQGIRLNW